MTQNIGWRDISPEEVALVTAIVSKSNVTGGEALIDELGGAVVSHSTSWILDVKTSKETAGMQLPNGPFPARTYVPSEAAYKGEVIIWIKDGHVDGLEYVWVTDDPPARWPRPDEVEVVPA